MKKILTASVITFLFAQGAQAAPDIYGKAFLTLDYVKGKKALDNQRNTSMATDKEDSLQINSNFSRLGVRGSEAVTPRTDVVYQLEYGVDLDGDGDQTLSNRDTYLGFFNKDYGELRLGRNSSILNYAYSPIVTRAYWDNLGKTKLGSDESLSALNMIDYTRKNNSILWLAPKYKNVKLIAQYATNEQATSKQKDGFGASVTFDRGEGFTAGLAYSKDLEVRGSIKSSDAVTNKNKEEINSIDYSGEVIRGTVTIDLDKYIDRSPPITLGVLYQQADYDFKGSDKERGLVVSGNMRLKNMNRPASVYIQYNNTDNLNGISNNVSDQIVVGGKYQFKDNIIAHAYAGQNSADYTDPKDNTHALKDMSVVAVGGGLEYLF